MVPIPFSQKYYSPTAPGRTVIAGVGGVESNYLLISAPCVKDYSDPDLPAIMLFAECLSTLEVSMLVMFVCWFVIFSLVCSFVCLFVRSFIHSILTPSVRRRGEGVG